MVVNELTIYTATNTSFLATKNSGLVAIIGTLFVYVEDQQWLFTQTLFVHVENHIERSSLLTDT